MNKLKQQAKRAMNTRGQKACIVIDHLVEALAGEPSSFIRRAQILNYINEHKNTTQTDIMKKFGITKSSINREIEWLFNHGCITRHNTIDDGRIITLEACGYSKLALDNALDYFPERHKGLHSFLDIYIKVLKQNRPTLRDARIISTIYSKKNASKSEVIATLYNAPATTNNRAYNKLVKNGVIKENG